MSDKTFYFAAGAIGGIVIGHYMSAKKANPPMQEEGVLDSLSAWWEKQWNH
ncbi:MAG: hypothetical protein V6Z82_07030 [Flavobacteriales bacterium]